MDVTWIGHSCFRLRWEQASLVTDPYNPDTLGLGAVDVTTNTVTVSHQHPHHDATAQVGGDFKVFRGPGEYEYMGALVKGVMTPRSPDDPPEKRNTAYHIEVEGVRLVHLGDVSAPLTTRQVDELTPADVVFVPAGAGCTVSVPPSLGDGANSFPSHSCPHALFSAGSVCAFGRSRRAPPSHGSR